MSARETLTQVAHRALKELDVAVNSMESAISVQKSEILDLARRVEDAEQRASLYEQRADGFKDKADRTDSLEETCKKLLDALDRLPLTMEDAGMKQMTVPPSIPLYGTHDWQAVMDAKLALKEAIKRS
jgi:hypothetical protein